MTARSSSYIVHSLTRPQPSLTHVRRLMPGDESGPVPKLSLPRYRYQWALSVPPKFSGWGSKISWCRMEREGSGQPRSIPLAKRVSRSLKWRMLNHCCAYQSYMSISTVISVILCELFQVYIILSGPCPEICRMSSNTTFEWRKEHSKFSREIDRLWHI